MQELQGQHLVDLSGVIPITFEVASHRRLDRVSFEIRSAKGSRIQEDILNVPREGIPVPDPEMVEFVPPEEEAFEAKGMKKVVDTRQALRHPVVIGILGLARKLREAVRDRRPQAPSAATKAAVGRNSCQRRVAICDEAQAEVVGRECGRGHTEDESDEVVVEIRGPKRQLALLQCEEAVVVSGGLPKDGEG